LFPFQVIKEKKTRRTTYFKYLSSQNSHPSYSCPTDLASQSSRKSFSAAIYFDRARQEQEDPTSSGSSSLLKSWGGVQTNEKKENVFVYLCICVCVCVSKTGREGEREGEREGL